MSEFVVSNFVTLSEECLMYLLVNSLRQLLETLVIENGFELKFY